MKFRKLLPALGMLSALWGGAAVAAPAAPSVIKLGTLYASSGPFAAISMPVYDGEKLWVKQMNAQGGVYVGAYHKKIPVKLIAYDDQSSTATAATLYNQLISQDHVDLLMADSGSVLTSVAVPIAKEHKMFLFDVSGTGGTFFSKDNPYIALMAIPVSTIWPSAISNFLDDVGVKNGIKTAAILYATNDFTGTQAHSLAGFLKKAGKIKIVYDQGVPTSTTNYTVLINNIAAHKPDAVIELGFPNNEIAFLRNLQDSGDTFRYLFTVYGGTEMDLLLKNVGAAGLAGSYSYVPSALYSYKVNYGPTLAQYRAMWDKEYPKGSGVEWGSNAVYGYQACLVMQRALATAKGLSQMDIHNAVFALSGKLKTLDGTFELNSEGAQIGEMTPMGQLVRKGKHGIGIVAVYPPEFAKAKAVFGK